MGSARLVAFTSGKGGVGKTSMTVNFAIELARKDNRVCLLDAASGATDVTSIMGLEPTATLYDVIDGSAKLDDILLECGGVTVVPSASFAAQMLSLDIKGRSRLLSALGELESRFDYLLIDCSSGIDESVIRFAQAAHHVVVVVTPERQSRIDAFTLIKGLRLNGVEAGLHLLCNLVSSRQQGRQIYRNLRAALHSYVGTELRYFGLVGPDPGVSAAITNQRPFALDAPQSLASRCLQHLATNVHGLLGESEVPVDNGTGADGAEDAGDTVDTGDIRGLGAFWMRALLAGEKPLVAVEETQQKPAQAPPEPSAQTPLTSAMDAPAPWATLRQQLSQGKLAKTEFVSEMAAILLDEDCFEPGLAREQALSVLNSHVLGRSRTATSAEASMSAEMRANELNVNRIEREKLELLRAAAVAARVAKQ